MLISQDDEYGEETDVNVKGQIEEVAYLGRDAGGAGLIGDLPHPRPIEEGMGPGLIGHGASTGIEFIPTTGMGMGMVMGFR